jgi:hypothetical protein
VKIKALAVAFVLFASVGNAQRLDHLSAASILSPTDKTLWLIPDQVEVGTVLITNPASWKQKGGAFFQPESDFLVGKIKTTQGPRTTETLVLDKKFDLSAVLPILGCIGGAFRSAKHISLNAVDQEITQGSTRLEVANALLNFDRRTSDPRETERAQLFANINRALNGAAMRSDQARYWLVTKVYRAATTSWTITSSKGAALGTGCTTAPSVADSTPSLPTAAPKPGNSSAAATSPATSGTIAASAKPAMTGNLNLSTNKGVAGAVNVSAGQAQATANTPSPNPSAAAPAKGCSVGQFGFGSGSGTTASQTKPIVFVQMKPILRNSSGRLYVPMPDGDDQVLAPKVARRS